VHGAQDGGVNPISARLGEQEVTLGFNAGSLWR